MYQHIAKIVASVLTNAIYYYIINHIFLILAYRERMEYPMDNKISEIFGSMVFNDDVMRERLPREVYKSLTKTVATGRTIDPSIADVVANAMKD